VAQKFTVPITIKELSSAGSDAITILVDEDSFSRLKIEAGGRLTWGTGSVSGDVNLYRDSANTLATDDIFRAFLGLVTKTVSGEPVDALPDGALVVDNTNEDFYFRTNGAWKQVSGGGASITISDTIPTEDITEGDLWFDSSTAKTFVYYDSFWVEIGGIA